MLLRGGKFSVDKIYAVPAAGTADCFPEGSSYTVESGRVVLHTSAGEITETEEYDMALCLYNYDVTLENVVISSPYGEFTLDIDKLTNPEDWENPSIIDPNGATMTISVPVFQMPPADAEGTIEIDGSSVLWSDIFPLLS